MSQRSDSHPGISWWNVVIGILLLARGGWLIKEGRPGPIAWLCLGIGSFWIGKALFAAWRNSQSGGDLKREPGDASAPHPDDAEDQPLCSLVLLLDSPRDITDTAWIDHLGKAHQLDFRGDDPNATTFVMPMPHPVVSDGGNCFMLSHPTGMFFILNSQRPYLAEPGKFAKSIPDRRLKEAMARHKAWISVDMLRLSDEAGDMNQAYDVIGKSIAALAGPDVLAIYSPELNRLNEFDPMLIPVLAGGSPLEVFEKSTFEPVLEAGDDDEQMEAAIAEARGRWHEFVGFFQARSPMDEKPFIVKSPFGTGDGIEHIWLEVSDIDGDFIRGTLANHPHRLTDYHQGQEVVVPAANLSDWLCLDSDSQPIGGWTQKVLAAKQRS